jgi:integrase
LVASPLGRAKEIQLDLHGTSGKALADALDEGLIPRNPANGAHSLRRSRGVPMRTWSADQMRTFLGHVADDRLATLWRLAATTGMRRGEVLGLRWRDVDLEGSALSVTQARVRGTQASRTVRRRQPPAGAASLSMQ